MAVSKLKPCPFCGSKAKVEPSYFARGAFVVKCADGHSDGMVYADKSSAAESWNMRAGATP